MNGEYILRDAYDIFAVDILWMQLKLLLATACNILADPNCCLHFLLCVLCVARHKAKQHARLCNQTSSCEVKTWPGLSPVLQTSNCSLCLVRFDSKAHRVLAGCLADHDDIDASITHAAKDVTGCTRNSNHPSALQTANRCSKACAVFVQVLEDLTADRKIPVQ